MKKLILLSSFAILSISIIFSAESSFSFTIPQQAGMHFQVAGTEFDNLRNYADAGITAQANDSVIENILLSHMILGALAIGSYVANSITGGFILAEKFLNQSYVDALLFVHIGIGLAGAILAASTLAVGYADIGIKMYNKQSYNKAFAVSIYMNTALLLTQVGVLIANLAVSLSGNTEAAKWVGLAHGITSGLVIVGLTIQLGFSYSKY